jgi:hypothetical protein
MTTLSYAKLAQQINNAESFGGFDRNGLSIKIVNLHRYNPGQARKRIIPSDFEVHEGWIQTLKNEKKYVME